MIEKVKRFLGGLPVGMFLVLALVGAVAVNGAVTGEAWAACASGETEVKTSLLGTSQTYCDDGKGGGVWYILNIALTIMTYGVAALGTLGVVIAGIMYLTARDNEAQAAKARKRLIEIIIGLILFAVMRVALDWLLPGGIGG